MDDSSFGLSENLQVLYHAGIRTVLASDPVPPKVSILSVSPWTDFVSKLPNTAKSIWSYPDLVYDLTGRASKERGELWRTMIRLMDLPKGFIGFFPYTLPADNSLITYFDHFYEVLTSHVPTSVLIFGDDAFAGRLLSVPTTAASWNLPYRVIAAPSPEKLCSYTLEELKRYLLQLLPMLITAA